MSVNPSASVSSLNFGKLLGDDTPHNKSSKQSSNETITLLDQPSTALNLNPNEATASKRGIDVRVHNVESKSLSSAQTSIELAIDTSDIDVNAENLDLGRELAYRALVLYGLSESEAELFMTEHPNWRVRHEEGDGTPINNQSLRDEVKSGVYATTLSDKAILVIEDFKKSPAAQGVRQELIAGLRDANREQVAKERAEFVARQEMGPEAGSALSAAGYYSKENEAVRIEAETDKRLGQVLDGIEQQRQARLLYKPEDLKEIQAARKALGEESGLARAVDVGMGRGAAFVDETAAGALRILNSLPQNETVQAWQDQLQRRAQRFRDITDLAIKDNPQTTTESIVSNSIEIGEQVVTTVAVSRITGGATRGLATLGALHKAGTNGTPGEIVIGGLKGAAIGLVFKGTAGAPPLPKMGAVGGTTYAIEKLTGATNDQAVKAAATNAIFAAFGGKETVQGLVGKNIKLLRDGKAVDVTVSRGADGNYSIQQTASKTSETNGSSVEMELKDGVWQTRKAQGAPAQETPLSMEKTRTTESTSSKAARPEPNINIHERQTTNHSLKDRLNQQLDQAKTNKQNSTENVAKVENEAPRKIKYSSKEMLSKYAEEETGSVWGTKVKYLNEVQRAELELFVNEGKIVDRSGKLYDTSSSSSVFGAGEGKSIFVMDATGRIYASNQQSVGKFHHSSILAGKPVSAAGEITVENGKITEISNRSGHYQPSQEMNSQIIKELKSRGVDVSNIKITGF